MKITWYGHACLRLEAGGVSVVTDPYTPTVSGFRPVPEPATIVVRSSPDDRFHCDSEMIPGSPLLVEAIELARGGPRTVGGVPFEAFPTQESLVHKSAPLDNAMYHFTLGGLGVLHLGDLGNPLDPAHVARLRGRVDVLLALAGGPPTIELHDLDRAIEALGARLVVPMHFKVPQLTINPLPVDVFLSRHQGDIVRRLGSPSAEVTPATLPARREIWVLDPAC
ncbi:MAG: MBL fold metallo-hydrolase [Candidatus Dormiibacterota bacterium]